MASGGFGGVKTHIFPSLGPAILVSMTYIDLGKWLAAVEGGARFGFELVLLVLIFNCIAILCQFLSTAIGMITWKNLAEICSEEYTRLPCILLGVQAELSMIISDLTMVLGIAHGVNLLLGMDLLLCILFAILVAILLPFLLKLSDNGKAAEFFVYIAGFALFFYVFGVLISQPEVPVINEFLPKLTGENAYAVMALLGANIMSHNFFIHSAITQQQGRQSNVAIGALFHDHLFAILIIFTGIFLVNYELITSAAAVFGNSDVVALNFQDVSFVMEQKFVSGVLQDTKARMRFGMRKNRDHKCPTGVIMPSLRMTRLCPGVATPGSGVASRCIETFGMTMLDLSVTMPPGLLSHMERFILLNRPRLKELILVHE